MNNPAKSYTEYDYDYDYYDDFSVDFTEETCLEWCKSKFKANPTATGCRFHVIDHDCISIRGADIENGDGETDVICWEFHSNVTGIIYIKYFPIQKQQAL